MCQVLILNLEAFNFRYNISFIDPPLGGFGEILPSVMIFPSGQSPSGNIITSGNISPNPPRSRSINDKCCYVIHNNVIFPLLIVLTVLGSCALYLSIINSVINCESFQVITLEVTTLDFVSKNIAKSAN